MQEHKFKSSLTLFDATMISVGSMIGSGIFIVSADISRNVGSGGWLIIVWVIAGLMTILGALSYGELSGMFPKAGGQYVYLKESYHPLLAFLYGWSLFAVIQTGTIAAVAVAFSKFTAYIIPFVSEDNILVDAGFLKISFAQILSICCIAFLTYVNTRGVEGGKKIQSIFTVTKLVSLFSLIVFGFIMFKSEIWKANWDDPWKIQKLTSNGEIPALGIMAALSAIATAMVGAVFSSDAWNNVTFVASEIKDPKRNVGRSLFLGTFTVMVIYVLANLMFLSILPLQEIAFAEKDRVGVAASDAIFGSAGTIIIALMIMVSTFGANNGLILSGSRVYYTMAKDGVFFKHAGVLNKFDVPGYALWTQCILACIWCLSGKYGDLLDMVAFIVVMFYVLTVLGIFILRIRKPNLERPYKAFAYPIFPLLYILFGLSFCTLLIIYKPNYTWPGLIITLIGVPIYFIAMAKKKKETRV